MGREGQDLECHVPPEGDLLHLVYGAHAAPAHFADNAKVTQDLRFRIAERGLRRLSSPLGSALKTTGAGDSKKLPRRVCSRSKASTLSRNAPPQPHASSKYAVRGVRRPFQGSDEDVPFVHVRHLQQRTASDAIKKCEKNHTSLQKMRIFCREAPPESPDANLPPTAGPAKSERKSIFGKRFARTCRGLRRLPSWSGR